MTDRYQGGKDCKDQHNRKLASGNRWEIDSLGTTRAKKKYSAEIKAIDVSEVYRGWPHSTTIRRRAIL